jgi:hypothetical protein
MSDPIEKLVADVSFPRAGELFAVFLLPFERNDFSSFGDVSEKVTVVDRSYRGDVWRCLASDASRVVAERIYGGSWKGEKPTIFYRPECRFDDVSLIASVLPLGNSDAA